MTEIGRVNKHKTTHQDGGDDELVLTGILPGVHKTTHQDAGADEISVSGLAGQQIFVPYNGKIADISESDKDPHFLDLETALAETRKIIAIFVWSTRIAGSGSVSFYPKEAAPSLWSYPAYAWGPVALANGTNRLKYSQNVPNDDYDLYCTGYIVET